MDRSPEPVHVKRYHPHDCGLLYGTIPSGSFQSHEPLKVENILWQELEGEVRDLKCGKDSVLV